MTGNHTSRHLVLLGMMGAGKTRTGAALSVRLGWPLVDGDAVLETQTGRTGARIAETDGVEHLHHLERQVLLDALGRDELAVIAPAACVVEDQHCVAELGRHAVVVWLDLSAEQLRQRMVGGEHRRVMEPEELHALLARRRPRFAAVADLHLDAAVPTDELVATIVTYLERPADTSPTSAIAT